MSKLHAPPKSSKATKVVTHETLDLRLLFTELCSRVLEVRGAAGLGKRPDILPVPKLKSAIHLLDPPGNYESETPNATPSGAGTNKNRPYDLRMESPEVSEICPEIRDVFEAHLMNDIESSELVLDPYNGTVRRFLGLKTNQDDVWAQGRARKHSKTNIFRVASTFEVEDFDYHWLDGSAKKRSELSREWGMYFATHKEMALFWSAMVEGQVSGKALSEMNAAVFETPIPPADFALILPTEREAFAKANLANLEPLNDNKDPSTSLVFSGYLEKFRKRAAVQNDRLAYILDKTCQFVALGATRNSVGMKLINEPKSYLHLVNIRLQTGEGKVGN
ncbi:hypothetical protein BDD12DRAFT_803523 [Trichophaea hybrida]|nr:hypothetical protein BDD12DRAFT_803523 [Trichophaea hybrida]